MLAIFVLSVQSVVAQNIFKAVVKDGDTKEVLVGVNAIVEKTTYGASSDADGTIIIKDIPDGVQRIKFSYLGYETETKSFTFPLASATPVEIFLEQDEEALEEVIISSTRGTRTIQNIPTRVEFISREELDEKGSMKPGDIRMLLNESTGIITQQTSATSGNAAIRIQGLDGRYTQILKDGFPVFAGAASGLGLLQTPPLDLKQVEIIKGSTSTLYGGGAIAGLVNLISKTPEEKRELSLHLNGTSGKGLDVSGFYGQKFEKVGTTIFAAYNRNWAYDPSNTGFTAIPQFDRYVFNPKLFLYLTENTEMSIGLNTMFENRLGGDIEYIKGKGDDVHSYFEENKNSYETELKSLDDEFKDIVANGRHRMIVVADKFPFRYFAQEYGLSYRAAFSGCSTDTEPSAKTIAYLIDRIKENQIQAVFYLELSSHRTADIISEETGAKPLLLHSCHNVTRRQFDEGVTYLQLMKQNAKNLQEALL